MDLVVFEESKSLIWEALQEGEFDYMESASEVFETDFFRFIKAKPILSKLAETYPTPRKKEEVPLLFYVASDLSIRLQPDVDLVSVEEPKAEEKKEARPQPAAVLKREKKRQQTLRERKEKNTPPRRHCCQARSGGHRSFSLLVFLSDSFDRCGQSGSLCRWPSKDLATHRHPGGKRIWSN